VSRGRRRVLDAALPAQVPVGRPSALLVLIRRTDSAGLRLVVESEPEYGITGEDVASKPVLLEFPTDERGIPRSLDLSIRIESPQFEPRLQSKNITVPPRGDSEPRIFFVTPTASGPLLVNLEVCLGERILAGCVLRTIGTFAAPGMETAPKSQTLVSAALPVSDADERTPSGEFGPVDVAERSIPMAKAPTRATPAAAPRRISWIIWPALIIVALIVLGMSLRHC